MEYVIVTIEWLTEHGVSVPVCARKSLDEKEVLLHIDFIHPALSQGEEIVVYNYDSDELREILEGDGWTRKEESLENM